MLLEITYSKVTGVVSLFPLRIYVIFQYISALKKQF